MVLVPNWHQKDCILIQFAEKSKNGNRAFLRHYGTQKHGVNGYHSLTFSKFSTIKNLLLYVRIESFNFGCGLVSFTCAWHKK